MADNTGRTGDDLTMVQPEPTIADKAIDNLSKDPGDGWVTLSKAQPKTEKAINQAMLDYTSKEFSRNMTELGGVDKELDAFRGFGTMQETRARNQSEGIKGLKAVGGGIYQGALIALEQIGYIADPDTYLNHFREVEDLSGNFWTRTMKEAQEASRESDIFKIYEEDPDENSLMSQIFKWSSLESAVASSVGFGVTGYGAAGLVSWLGSYGKLKQLAKLTDMTMGNIAGKSMEGATRAFTGPLASSAMSNYFMGQMMATETYTQSMAELQDAIDGEEITTLEAQKLASNNAQEVVGLNMALTVTGQLRFGNIFKRTKGVQAWIKNPSTRNHIKDLIVKGAPTAFVENVYQEMIQMEQVYDTKAEAGVATDYASDYWDRMANLALSNRALHAGALGIAGGPIQFAIIQKPFMRKQFAAQRKAHVAQQEGKTWFEEVVRKDAGNFVKWDDAMNKAAISGDMSTAEMASDLGVADQIVKSFTWGYSDFVKGDMQKIVKYTGEEAAKQGLDENYKDVAQKMVKSIEAAEGHFLKHGGKENADGIVFNRMASDRASIEEIKIYGEGREAFSKVEESLRLHPILEGVELTSDLKVKRDKDRFKDLSATEKAKEITKEFKQDNLLKDNPNVKEFIDIKKRQARVVKFQKELATKFDYMVSDKGQRAYKKKQDDLLNNYEETTKKEAQQIKEEEISKANRNTRTMETVRAEISKETDQQKEERIAKWDSEITDAVSTIRPRKTFTGKERKSGKRALYTPGDLRRSQDGRYFQVTSQDDFFGKYKGNVTVEAMPVIREVTEKGYKIKGKENTILLDTHDFLRPEVMQAQFTAAGVPFYKGSQWAVYVEADSVRKPNNRAFVAKEEENAADGIALTVNNFEYISNTSEIHVSSPMVKDGYKLDRLNRPLFEGQEYKVKLRDNVPNKSIDVYEVLANGEEIKLSRLNKHSNMNYALIADALNKGEVTGTVIEHYSNKHNFVKKLDADGNVVRSSVADLAKLPKGQLINNTVFISQTPSKEGFVGDYIASTIDDKGNTYPDGVIPVDIGNGVIQQIEIPYGAMNPGDTSALIMGPGGRIIPMALAAGKLGDTQSKIGKEGSMVEDVIESSWKAIRDTFPEIMKDEKAYNESIRKISDDEISPEISPVEQFTLIKDDKKTIIFDKNEDLYTAMKEGPYMQFREFTRTRHREYQVDGSFIVPTYTAYNGKEQSYINQQHFSIQTFVDKSNNLTPTIKIPKNDKSWEYVLLTEQPDRFRELLGNRMLRMPITDLMKGGKEVADKMIHSGDLTVDIDPTKGIAGSSATIVLDGQDFKSDGAALAMIDREAYESPMVNMFSEPNKDAIDNTEFKINEFINLASSESDNLRASVSDSPQNVVKTSMSFIRGLGLKYNVKEGRKAEVYFNSDVISSEYEVVYNDALNVLAKSALPESISTEAIAKAYAYLSVLAKDIIAKTVPIQVKTNSLNADRSIRYIQPEGRKFKRGDTAYSSIYGTQKIVRVYDKGPIEYYFIETDGGKKKIYPNETFSNNGKYKELDITEQKLNKLTEGTPEFVIAKDKITALQNELYKVNDNKPAQNSDNSTNSNISVYSIDEFLDVITTGSAKAISHIRSLSVTDRVEEFRKAMNTTQQFRNSFEGVDVKTPATQDQVELALKTMQNSIPYTIQQLEDMVGKAENGSQYTAQIDDYITFVRNLQAADGTQPAVGYELKVMSERTGKFNEIVTYVPGLIWSTERKDNIPDYYRGNVTIAHIKDMSKNGAARTSNIFNIESIINQYPIASDTPKVVEVSGAVKPVIESSPTPPKIIKEVSANQASVDAMKKRQAEESEKKGTEPTGIDHREIILKDNSEEYLREQLMFDDSSLEALYTADVPLSTKKEVINNLALAGSTIGILAETVRIALEGAGIIKEKKDSLFDEDGNTLFKRGDDITNTAQEFQQEVSNIKRMLPQVPTEVVENVAAMVDKFGVKAIGAFDKGVRYLVYNAKRGTAYHETFHAVAGIYLRSFQKQAIAEEMGHTKWTSKLDEMLADKFAGYMIAEDKRTYYDKLTDKVRKFFDGLISWLRGTRGPDITQKLFEDIAKGKFANSVNEQYLSSMENYKMQNETVERVKAQMSTRNNVTLQGLLDKGKIKIIC